MGNQWNQWEINGKSMEIYGNKWEINGKSMEINGKTMEINGKLEQFDTIQNSREIKRNG
jgi:hypothetical protein